MKSILDKGERVVAGLMSGTSMDGVDAALVRIAGSGKDMGIELLEFVCRPYAPDVHEMLLGAPGLSTPELSDLGFTVGREFAAAALELIEKAGMRPRQVDLVGSHGQTVYHNPPSRGGPVSSTLQLGELDVIAKLTGITTVGDFRPADMAVGGEGAPLVPYVDFVLYNDPERVRIAQNIGGISNATLVTVFLRQVVAFDTGPGNMLMDNVMRLATGGEARYDTGGALARKGEVSGGLLEELLADPYYTKPPPKSTGAELFGPSLSAGLYDRVREGRMRLEDMMRTLLELTVESTARAYEAFLFPRMKVDGVIVSGGGVRNGFLMERLRDRLSPLPVETSDEHGIPAEAKEAIAMAVLANELISANNTNIITATGAAKCVPVGKIALGGGL